jgi:hypothetical protein
VVVYVGRRYHDAITTLISPCRLAAVIRIDKNSRFPLNHQTPLRQSKSSTRPPQTTAGKYHRVEEDETARHDAPVSIRAWVWAMSR